MSRFLRKPVSVTGAANFIVVVTAAVVILGGILMRVLDGEEYPNVWKGMWWALQTVTTVGYGDVTPQNTSGRIVAAFIMLEGVAFLSIVIAAITSIFVARAQRESAAGQALAVDHGAAELHERFDELQARLDRLEKLLSPPGLDLRGGLGRLRRPGLELSDGQPTKRLVAQRDETAEDEHAEPACAAPGRGPRGRAGGRRRPAPPTRLPAGLGASGRSLREHGARSRTGLRALRRGS